MTVRAVGATHHRFMGLTTDDKPVDVNDGAEFKTMDTGEKWVFFDGVWILDPTTTALPQRILGVV